MPKETRRFIPPKPKVCPFCAEGVKEIDYKDVEVLQRFLSSTGRIKPRQRTGVCAKHQRQLSTALKRARHLALLPFTPDHIRWSGGVGVSEQPS